MNAYFIRQSFLGEDSQILFAECRVGIIGLGGGGSHIVQQLAHIGFQRFTLYDPDRIEEHNLNRLIGSTKADVDCSRLKTTIARRTILNLQPNAHIIPIDKRWNENPNPLKRCDIVFGCVDTFSEREQLERTCRRYLIPYIDIGMDVNIGSDGIPVIGGQVILSLPSGPCMRCLEVITDERLSKEAAQYGDAGVHPQVVWPNGILASSAVGIAVDLITGWSHSKQRYVFLSYDGNRGTVMPHIRNSYMDQVNCPHFSLSYVGDPILNKL